MAKKKNTDCVLNGSCMFCSTHTSFTGQLPAADCRANTRSFHISGPTTWKSLLHHFLFDNHAVCSLLENMVIWMCLVKGGFNQKWQLISVDSIDWCRLSIQFIEIIDVCQMKLETIRTIDELYLLAGYCISAACSLIECRSSTILSN